MNLNHTNIRFTDAALTFSKKMVEKDKGIGLRLTVKKTGCSGYAYHVEVVKDICTLDLSLELSNGLKVFVDPTWLHFFEGLQVDYVIEDNLGLKQTRLVFENINESSRCGCGKSFHIENDKK
jgi:iron-sulfur cluster assembly protein